MVAIAESFRDWWGREAERRELAELERYARWLLRLRDHPSALP